MAIRQPKSGAVPDYPSPYHGRQMTPAEYLALPEEKPYLEYVDGVVRQKPMVTWKHRRLVGKLDFLFGLYQREAGGDFGPEGTVELSAIRHFRLPDTAYWAKGRPSQNNAPPSLAVEVRSPGQSLRELREKCRAFRANGVDACWLIDPDARTVEVFEDDRDGATVKGEATLTCAAMPGFELLLSDLFSVLDD